MSDMVVGIGFETLRLDTEYRTGESDPVDQFYRPCLARAVTYDRAVGYFRSSIFNIVGEPLLEFAKRGGRMRLVCSPSITDDDATAIAKGYLERDEIIGKALTKDVEDMLSDPALASQTQILATLVKTGALDIRIAFRKDASGIYHEKIGVFADATGQRVSFLGSANETWSAWHIQGNHESVEVFRENGSSNDAKRVSKHVANFDRLWAGNVVGVDTLQFPEAQKQRLLTRAVPSLDDIPMPPKPATDPSRRTPMKHQIDAIAAWEAAGRRGVFEHATGSGKTFTAITAIKKHVAAGQPAIILVPSQLLLEQWRLEVKEEIPDATILMAGGGHTKWREGGRLRSHTQPDMPEMKRITISTMQTAASTQFVRDAWGGEHLLLVADEVHQIGSPFNSNSMSLASGASMGLSATPTRYGDPEGTARMFERFGNIVPPPITLEDAIKSGRLVDYEYHPHPVNLDEQEAAEWKSLTKRISLEIARSSNNEGENGKLSLKTKMLLIQRSRIAKKARVKPGLAVGVIKREYEPGQRWLVYCEDADQLAETIRLLADAGLSPLEYHSNMTGDKSAALAYFRQFGGVLVSIRCLDEGVDIPAVSHAFILASSQNPRQFIQRRGRVLRKSPDKHMAVIHDAIVIPVAGDDDKSQTSLLRAEIARAMQFARSATNKMAGIELEAIALDLGIQVDNAGYAGIEEEELSE
ncbi:MAG: DEAD/DEAH box helicase family protein [Comamonadaceae bacterium]|jgi:superfamily II DNA or RNA helicase|nr:DEAD/DEAH box helicase family protein [Comamonadaceae bacterium]